MSIEAELERRMRSASTWEPDIDGGLREVQRRVRARTRRIQAGIAAALLLAAGIGGFVLLPDGTDDDASVIVGEPEIVDEADLLGELAVPLVELVGSLNREALLSEASMQAEHGDADVRTQLDEQRAVTDRLLDVVMPGLEEAAAPAPPLDAGRLTDTSAFAASVESLRSRVDSLAVVRTSVDLQQVHPEVAADQLLETGAAAAKVLASPRADGLHHRAQLDATLLLELQQARARAVAAALSLPAGSDAETELGVLADARVAADDAAFRLSRLASKRTLRRVGADGAQTALDDLLAPDPPVRPSAATLLDAGILLCERETEWATSVLGDAPRTLPRSDGGVNVEEPLVELIQALELEGALPPYPLNNPEGYVVPVYARTDDAIDGYREAMVSVQPATDELERAIAVVDRELRLLDVVRGEARGGEGAFENAGVRTAPYMSTVAAIRDALLAWDADDGFVRQATIELVLLLDYEASSFEIAVLHRDMTHPAWDGIEALLTRRAQEKRAIEDLVTPSTKSALRRVALAERAANDLTLLRAGLDSAHDVLPGPSSAGATYLTAVQEVVDSLIALDEE